jgi:hypothetical protein
MNLLPVYIISACILIKQIPFVIPVAAFAVFTYFKFFKKNVAKEPLIIEDFLSRDQDIVKALTLLHDNNTYRTDINERVSNLLYKFVSIYTELLFQFDIQKYDSLVLYEKLLLETLSSLEFEKDIPYKGAFNAMELVTTKYKTILSNKYSIDLNAANPSDNISHIRYMI